MPTELYNIVYYGEIAAGTSLEGVKKNLATMFNLTPQQIERAFSGEPWVLKKQIDYQAALKYKATFERAGTVCRIEPLHATSQPIQVPPLTSEQTVSPPVSHPPEPKTMTCPKCGFEQEEAIRCQRCGIFIKNYLKMQERESTSTQDREPTRTIGQRGHPPSPRLAQATWKALLGIAVLIGVGLIVYLTTKEEVVKSKNYAFQLTKPRGWRVENDLNEEADIQISRRAAEAYLIVISDYKTDFTSDMDYKRHSILTRGFFKESLQNYTEVSGPTRIEVNGMKGIQYEITGSIEGIKAQYLHTTLEGKRYFHQLAAWSVSSQYESNKPVFQQIIQSFRE
jgi:hypothetical protein